MKMGTIIFSLIIWGFFFFFATLPSIPSPQGRGELWAQAPAPSTSSGQAPESPVGVVPEAPPPEEEEPPSITLKLAGDGCDININEAELRHVKGVLEVDIESDLGHIIVYYDGKKATKQQIKAAVGKKKGGCAAGEKGAQ